MAMAEIIFALELAPKGHAKALCHGLQANLCICTVGRVIRNNFFLVALCFSKNLLSRFKSCEAQALSMPEKRGRL